MKRRDILKLATRIFKTNKLRTALTVLGIGVGIGSILFLVSLGYGLQKVILDKIASSDALLTLDIASGISEELKLDNNIIDKLSRDEMVDEISPLVVYNSLFEYKDLNGGVELNFTQNSYFRLSGVDLEYGKSYSDEDLNGVVISTAILKLLNIEIDFFDKDKMAGISITVIKPDNSPDSMGQVELIDIGKSYYVTGVILDDTQPIIYSNIKNINDFNVTEYNRIKVKAKEKKFVEEIKNKISDYGYLATSISETIDQANKIFNVIKIALAVFGVIALIVSAIGMFNTMTITLLQRTKEIGIMKSLGAKNKDIKGLFLTESILIGFLGGLSGLVIGYLMQIIFSLLLGILAKTMGGEMVDVFFTPFWFIALIITFSTVVGLLTGVWPAKRASKLNPLDALRYK